MDRIAVVWVAVAVLTCSGCEMTALLGQPNEICDDRLDNDGDLKTDCADPQCFDSPMCCLDTCNEGAMLCDEGGVRGCELDTQTHCRHFGVPQACQASLICSGGSCVSHCVDQCALGARSCVSPGAVAECTTFSTGCTEWAEKTTCELGEACTSGVCLDVATCTDACLAGKKRCTASGQQQTCIRLSAKCTDWAFPQSCGQGLSCQPSTSECGPSTDGGGAQSVSTRLAALAASAGVLNPAFSPSTTMYVVSVAASVTSVTVTPTAESSAAMIRVNGVLTASGASSQSIGLVNGVASVGVTVVNALGENTSYGLVFIVPSALKQQAYLKASNTGATDYLGTRVALSGDTLAVGAVCESSAAEGVNGNQADNSAPCSGAVYVFVRTGAAWTQQAYVKSSNSEASDQFGRSVALSGNTLAVGAVGEDSAATGSGATQTDNSASSSGAVYVFERSGGVWTQQAYLKASNTGSGDNFGGAVALSGNTLAVAAAQERSAATGINGNQSDDSAAGAGAVYVFVRSGVAWAQQAYLKASNTGANDGFGVEIALSGDTLAVGAYSEGSSATGINGQEMDNSAPGSGAVYIFVRSGTAWAQQAYLKGSNTEADDRFGVGLALSGDTLAVGAADEDSAATGVNGNQTDNAAANSGAVYVFVRTGATWAQQAYLKASNAEAADEFGVSIALSGDLLAVGAHEASSAVGINGNETDNSAPNSGAVYVFLRTAGVWTQRAYLKASNAARDDNFCVLALSGETLAVGAIGESSSAKGVNGDQADNSAAFSGAVYVFSP
jgi:hypothetical protein